MNLEAFPRTVTAKELRVGDTVRALKSEAWSTALVKEVSELWATFFRPYGVTADFETGGEDGTKKVVCYMGVETWRAPRDDEEYRLLDRQVLR